jgi:4'-phosphopantetheinyl transferase EntD
VPIVDLLILSTLHPTLAPPGQHVDSLFCQHVAPESPDRSSWDRQRERVPDLMIDTARGRQQFFSGPVNGLLFLDTAVTYNSVNILAKMDTKKALRHSNNADHLAPPLTSLHPHADRASDSLFLFGEQYCLPNGLTGSCFLARYYVHHFDVRLFDEFEIKLPEAIAASVPKRQAEFLAGRICAAEALRRAGLPHPQIPVDLHRSPRWPDGVIGSITHAGGYSAAAVISSTQARGLGLDIELIMDQESAESIQHLIAGPAELQRLFARRSDRDRPFLLTLLFSAKESFFKAAFPQVRAYFDFDAIELSELDIAGGRLGFRCVEALSEQLQPGYSFSVHFETLGSTALITAMLLR